MFEVPNLRPQDLTSSDQMFLYKNCTVMGDLKGAPAVHFYFPMQTFSLYIIFKSGTAAAGEPIPELE